MDLDTLLHLSATVDEPSPGAVAAGRTRLDQELTTDRSFRSRTRRPFMKAAAAAAAIAAVVVVPSVGVGGAKPAASADAAEVLHRAALAAGVQPDGGWKDAAYWYSKSTSTQSGRRTTREIWIGHRAIGVLKDSGHIIPLDVASFPAGGSSISWDGLWDLPTDPARLARQLRDGIHGAGNGDDAELFVIVGDLLRESPAPPKLRAALYDVAATIPGVHLVGPVTDAAGRPGTAVERDGQRLTFDQGDGRLLAETEGDPTAPEHVITDATGKVVGADSVGFASTYLEQGPRDSAPSVR